jgi:hypothetical protein
MAANDRFQVIQLTDNRPDSLGRATYSSPMHLWDNTSGNLTDFTTHFSFVIDSQNRTGYGDGFAFFLAPNGSKIPPHSTVGGFFGLTNDDSPTNTKDNQFVAVEFDIYPFNATKPWGPPFVHVGIDVNSLNSSAYVHGKGVIFLLWKGELMKLGLVIILLLII